MSQMPVKWCCSADLQDKAEAIAVYGDEPVAVVPLSALQDLFEDYYIGLAALQQTPEDTLLRLSVKTRLRQATQRLLASLGEVK